MCKLPSHTVPTLDLDFNVCPSCRDSNTSNYHENDDEDRLDTHLFSLLYIFCVLLESGVSLVVSMLFELSEVSLENTDWPLMRVWDCTTAGASSTRIHDSCPSRFRYRLLQLARETSNH